MMRSLLPRRQVAPRQMDSALPVVSLVLLLLFFFMIAGDTTRLGPDMALARTGMLRLERLPSPALVVRAADDWELDGRPIAPDLVAAALPGGEGSVLHLLIDRDAPATLLLDTLAHPSLADFRLRLVTLRETGAP